MAIKYYLQVNGIPGDSTAQDFRNWIDTLSYSWGGDTSATFQDPVSRAAHQPLLVTTDCGKHTTRMLERFHTRDQISEVVLVGVENTTEIIRITLSGVRIRQWEMAGSASADVPVESWSLLYASARVRMGNLEATWTTSAR